VTTDQDQDSVELSAADEQLLRELTERARTGGLKLTGEGGLLGKLTKMVLEGALEGELDDHLGYEKNNPAGRVDVFSRRPLRGNGLVVVLDTENLSTAVMQELTREVRQFETAFLAGVDLPGRSARLRIFT
jgi:Phenazine biosynthesis-like protein